MSPRFTRSRALGASVLDVFGEGRVDNRRREGSIEMTSFLQRHSGLFVVAICSVVLTACGGGGKSGGSSSSSATTTGSQTSPSSNAAPTITGKPSSAVAAGQLYTFVPAATDPEGGSLGFSIQNRPAWASFDTVTGKLSGTPSASQKKSYTNIVISVSDGSHSVSLPAFSIAVTDVGAGTPGVGAATLSWMPPSANTDGTPIQDLAGYEIRFGKSATVLDQIISIQNPSISTYVVEGLGSGTWYFSVVAVNKQGATSQPSNVASKTIA